MARRAVAWFRNDLRIKDNELLHHAKLRNSEELIALYCVDPRHYEKSIWGEQNRTCEHRSRFLAESVEALDKSLKSVGSSLLVVDGRPEDVIPKLMKNGDVLAFQNEDAHEEREVEEAVLQALEPGVSVVRHSGFTLRHPDDLGWNPAVWLPLPFGKFYHETCSVVMPRKLLPDIEVGALPKSPKNLSTVIPGTLCTVPAATNALATLMGFGMKSGSRWQQSVTADFVWKGGEDEALKRLQEYCSEKGLGGYHRTRNQLQGSMSFSHLSAWLAAGCISARTIYWRAMKFEQENKAKSKEKHFDHVQKFLFQLCWRDYFHFYCQHFGKRIFYLTGPARRTRPWQRNAEIEAKWKEGRTGVPLVDALMRELATTGYMANRGRYIVASYLVFFLNIDWRVGADWFESQLIDHDVCINYGEWASMANVAVDLGEKYPLGLKGRGPTGGRHQGARGGGGDPWAKGVSLGDAIFDPFEQAAHYDRDESYVRKWLPELKSVPPGLAHRPVSAVQGYPAPLAVEPNQLTRARNTSMQASVKKAARPKTRWDDKPAASSTDGARQLLEKTQSTSQERVQTETSLDVAPVQASSSECSERSGRPVRRWRPKFPCQSASGSTYYPSDQMAGS
eukprot:TRINITY_DN21622_c0_g1_i1.p1 TRINITY_DN21622_c0_g1~~TRINITY_DN21622_c0_g1_i1.p1  ORF type:complete len:642 (-),score=104.66 TRINITY_DN21622_c0_g1_i1:487-2349(-)